MDSIYFSNNIIHGLCRLLFFFIFSKTEVIDVVSLQLFFALVFHCIEWDAMVSNGVSIHSDRLYTVPLSDVLTVCLLMLVLDGFSARLGLAVADEQSHAMKA